MKKLWKATVLSVALTTLTILTACGNWDKKTNDTNATSHLLHVVLKDGKLTTPDEPGWKTYPYLHLIQEELLIAINDKTEITVNVTEILNPDSITDWVIDGQTDTLKRHSVFISWYPNSWDTTKENNKE